MMAAKDVKMSTDNLSCPVCYELFKKPKYLPCHHSYCEQCLEKMQKHSKIVCPECRKEAAIPSGGVKDFDDNFFVNRLVDEFILKRKVEGEEEVKCDDCQGEDPVEAFCQDCVMFLCHVCNEHHKRSIKSRDHGIVPLTELKSKKDVLIQPKAKAMMCREHDIELLFYCETCDQLVCMYCTVKGHNGHNHDTVKNVVDKHRQELRKITAPVEGMVKDLSNIHDNIEKKKKKIKQQGDEVNKKIDQHYDNAIQKLTEEKKQLNQEVDTTVSIREKVVTKQLSNVEHVQAEVLRVKKLKIDMEKSSDQEVLSVKKEVIDRMKQITDKYKRVNQPSSQQTTMEFIPSKKSLSQYGILCCGTEPHKHLVNSPTKSKKDIATCAVTTHSEGNSARTAGVTSSASVKSGVKSTCAVTTHSERKSASTAGVTLTKTVKIGVQPNTTGSRAAHTTVSSTKGTLSTNDMTKCPLQKPISGVQSNTMGSKAVHTTVSSTKGTLSTNDMTKGPLQKPISGVQCSTTTSYTTVPSFTGGLFNVTNQPLGKPTTGTNSAVATYTNRITPFGSGQTSGYTTGLVPLPTGGVGVVAMPTTVPIMGAQSPGAAKVVSDYLAAQKVVGPGVTSMPVSPAQATSLNTTQAKPALANNITGATSPITDSKSGRKRKYCEMCDGCKAPKCLTCKFCLDPALKKPCIMKICKQPQE